MRNLTTKAGSAIKTVVVAALVLGVVVLLAFGPRATDELPKDRVVVEYWEHWTGDEEAGMRAIVDDFNATVGREKKIFVRYASTSDIEKRH